MDTFLSQFASHGPIGLIAALALWAYFKKDRQVSTLYRRLEAKGEKMVERYHLLGTETVETLKALVDSLEGGDR